MSRVSCNCKCHNMRENHEIANAPPQHSSIYICTPSDIADTYLQKTGFCLVIHGARQFYGQGVCVAGALDDCNYEYIYSWAEISYTCPIRTQLDFIYDEFVKKFNKSIWWWLQCQRNWNYLDLDHVCCGILTIFADYLFMYLSFDIKFHGAQTLFNFLYILSGYFMREIKYCSKIFHRVHRSCWTGSARAHGDDRIRAKISVGLEYRNRKGKIAFSMCARKRIRMYVCVCVWSVICIYMICFVWVRECERWWSRDENITICAVCTLHTPIQWGCAARLKLTIRLRCRSPVHEDYIKYSRVSVNIREVRARRAISTDRMYMWLQATAMWWARARSANSECALWCERGLWSRCHRCLGLAICWW